MAQQNLQDTDTGPVAKGKIQGNFDELYAGVAQAEADAIAAAATDATSKANAAQAAAISAAATDATSKANAAQAAATSVAATDATTKANAAQAAAIAAAATDATTKANAAQAAAIAAAATDATTKADAAAAASVPLSQKGAANGVASLDGSGKVPSAQLPGFVDDVLEYANLAAFPATGSAGLLYVALDTNKIYRWSGSAYIEISPSPGSTDAVTEGAVNLYHTAARVRAVMLTGLDTATAAAVTAGDTVLSAIGKLVALLAGKVDSTDGRLSDARTPSGPGIAAATSKTTPDDADSLPASDSAASGALKRFTWVNIKTALGAIFANRGAIGSSGLTMTTARLLGRSTAGTGALEEITLGTNLSFSGTTLNAAGGGGSPGGSSGHIQYNNAGAFGGVAGFTFDGTSSISLGVAGTSVGSLVLRNATSGSVTLQPATGALGSGVFTIPAGTNTAATLGANTFAGTQTITTGGATITGLVNGTAFLSGFYVQANTQFMFGSGGSGDVAFQRNAAGVAEVNSTTAGQYRDLRLRNLIAEQLVQTKALTVATLPAAASWPGAEAYVTDANAPSVGSTVASGGSGRARVSSNATNWIVTAVI